MKKTLAALGIALAAVLTGCNDSDGGSKPTATNGAAGASATAGTAAAVKPYPLDICVVSGEKLGSMGEPIVLEYQGQQIKLCCKNCKPDFEKEPAKFIAKLAGK